MDRAFAEKKIIELIQRENLAWNTQNVSMLLSIFHPDMVWPWPPTNCDHDPITWIIPWGRYDYSRWGKGWHDLFDTHELIHNIRDIRKIEVTVECDGGFAVVDIDTLWKHKTTGETQHWKGRTCKLYTRLESGEWKFYAQYGVLDYH